MTPPLKQQAHTLVDNLPESATWDDLAYEAELRASIDRGLADSEAGHVVAIDDMMKEFGVEESIAQACYTTDYRAPTPRVPRSRIARSVGAPLPSHLLGKG